MKSRLLLAGIALCAAPSAFADYKFQFRGPVTNCVSNSGGCEATEEIFFEFTLDSANYTLGEDCNEMDTFDPRALHGFRYYIELNYPPNPPTSQGQHVILASTFSTTGNNTPDYGIRAMDLPATYGSSSTTSRIDFSATYAVMPNRATTLALLSEDSGWSIQFVEVAAQAIKYTRYSGPGGSWKLLYPTFVNSGSPF